LSKGYDHCLGFVLGFGGIHRGKAFYRQLRERMKHGAALCGREHGFDVGAHPGQRTRRCGDEVRSSLGS
jgi:hypothetical protein